MADRAYRRVRAQSRNGRGRVVPQFFQIVPSRLRATESPGGARGALLGTRSLVTQCVPLNGPRDRGFRFGDPQKPRFRGGHPWPRPAIPSVEFRVWHAQTVAVPPPGAGQQVSAGAFGPPREPLRPPCRRPPGLAPGRRRRRVEVQGPAEKRSGGRTGPRTTLLLARRLGSMGLVRRAADREFPEDRVTRLSLLGSGSRPGAFPAGWGRRL
jgi:hypothetical protein